MFKFIIMYNVNIFLHLENNNLYFVDVKNYVLYFYFIFLNFNVLILILNIIKTLSYTS